ncbi:DUF4870 domain-containing protein [Parafrigoribacterium soli]|uniref:DUF4870 domain-containing protein n=1 Tax=Parafrigoribacterium soli TaxID=3144663 RepID=UPI0032ED9FF8
MTDPTPQPAAPQPAAPLTASDDKLWASLAHFGGILSILPSLIIFLVFKDRGALTRQESKEALNWQITWLAVDIISFIIGMATIWFGVGFFFLTVIPWILYIANVVFSILGGVKVNSGGAYRYPVSVRLIK